MAKLDKYMHTNMMSLKYSPKECLPPSQVAIAASLFTVTAASWSPVWSIGSVCSARSVSMATSAPSPCVQKDPHKAIETVIIKRQCTK